MNRYKFDEKIHLHTLDGKPLIGTSTVVGVLSKPLTWWASGKALEPLGWTPTKTDKAERLRQVSEKLAELHEIEEPKEYLKLLDKCYRNHKDSLDKSADKGIDLHSDLELYIRSVMERGIDEWDKTSNFNPRIQPFILWAEKNVKKFLWSEAHCYSEKLWCGGICDAGALLNDGTIALIDFKSAKEAYTSHYIQCAGYALEIEENGLLDKDGNPYDMEYCNEPIQKLIVVPFGAGKVEPKENIIGIGEYKQGFEACCKLQKLLNLEERARE